jgi:hypothetical protein
MTIYFRTLASRQFLFVSNAGEEGDRRKFAADNRFSLAEICDGNEW